MPREELHAEGGKYLDPVIGAYKKEVDRTLLREALKLTRDQRIRALEALMQNAAEMQRAMKAALQPCFPTKFKVKRAAARVKDFLPVAELESLLEERNRLVDDSRKPNS